MCADLPKVAFLAMDARHCAGTEMAEIMAYAASVGSERATRKADAVGEYEVFYNDYEALFHVPTRIENITAEQLRETAYRLERSAGSLGDVVARFGTGGEG